MARIVVNMANLDPARAKAIVEICPFGAMEYVDGKIIINGSCRMCRLCLKRDTGGAIRFEDTPRPVIDKSKWKGIAVYAELSGGALHPVSLELLGKARELAAKVGQEVYAPVKRLQSSWSPTVPTASTSTSTRSWRTSASNPTAR